MKKQDLNGVRTAQDVERRHNLGAIPGLESDVDTLKEERVVDDQLSSSSTNPVQNKKITQALNGLNNILTGKVDKVTGKGLSSNDFTNADKESIHTHSNKLLLDEISSNDLYNLDNVYPVNSVYLSLSNANPNILIGGTWVYIDSLTIGSTTVYAYKRVNDEEEEND